MLIRDVLTVLLAMALFVFALEPREQFHGPRRWADADVSSIEPDFESGLPTIERRQP